MASFWWESTNSLSSPLPGLPLCSSLGFKDLSQSSTLSQMGIQIMILMTAKIDKEAGGMLKCEPQKQQKTIFLLTRLETCGSGFSIPPPMSKCKASMDQMRLGRSPQKLITQLPYQVTYKFSLRFMGDFSPKFKP